MVHLVLDLPQKVRKGLHCIAAPVYVHADVQVRQRLVTIFVSAVVHLDVHIILITNLASRVVPALPIINSVSKNHLAGYALKHFEEAPRLELLDALVLHEVVRVDRARLAEGRAWVETLEPAISLLLRCCLRPIVFYLAFFDDHILFLFKIDFNKLI